MLPDGEIGRDTILAEIYQDMPTLKNMPISFTNEPRGNPKGKDKHLSGNSGTYMPSGSWDEPV